jgi:RNA polymerase sigma-70 factor (ECF subfamily)
VTPSAPAVVAPRRDLRGDAQARVAEVVELARAGDLEAFGELFDRFHGPVHRQLHLLTRSESVAEELTSETFFRALRAMPTFTLPAHTFEPWLKRIARNLALDHFRAGRSRVELSTSDLSLLRDLANGPADVAVAASTSEQLREALARLPANQRRAVDLRFLQQRSIAETAIALGCTEGAVKQLQWRALRNLRRLFEPEDRGD